MIILFFVKHICSWSVHDIFYDTDFVKKKLIGSIATQLPPPTPFFLTTTHYLFFLNGSWIFPHNPKSEVLLTYGISELLKPLVQ